MSVDHFSGTAEIEIDGHGTEGDCLSGIGGERAGICAEQL
jgi:hypothetical protein